jgi:uncharacterized protein (UPF0261 family)
MRPTFTIAPSIGGVGKMKMVKVGKNNQVPTKYNEPIALF